MNRNIEIHESLIESGDIVCPFCDQKLDSNENKIVKYNLCCDCQDIINDKGSIVCISCGVVQGYIFAEEYVDFHSNKHKMKPKSVCHRQYHINNKLLDIKQNY